MYILPKPNQSSEPTPDSFVALRVLCCGGAAWLNRYVILRKNMRNTAILAIILLACGCSQSDPATILVDNFWSAVQNNDVALLETLMSEPENAGMFGKDSGFSINAESISVGDKLDNGNVNVVIKRFCYPDSSLETKLVSINDKLKVDVRETINTMMKSVGDSKPTRKYCYSFDDQPMSGKISGKMVTMKYFNSEIVDYGTHKKESFVLTTEQCPDNNCYQLMTPKILLNDLNFESDGGNFSNTQNITLFTPPHFNSIIPSGSYRVTKTEAGRIRLEISFREDDDNYINGYIEY